MKVIAIAGVLNNKTDLYGDKFSDEALEDIARLSGKVPVSMDFSRRVGEAFCFEKSPDNEIICEMQLVDGEIDITLFVPVVGLMIHNETGDIKIYEVSLVEPERAATLNTWIKEINDKKKRS